MPHPRVEVLTAEDRMHPAGLQAVEDSRAAGLGDAMEDVDDLLVPEDLAAALAARPGATERFLAIPPSGRRFARRWTATAKTDATRQRRVTTTADLASEGTRVPGS